MSSDYVERNRGVITGSKYKCHKKSPGLYRVKYVDEVVLSADPERYFIVGEAYHYLWEVGEAKFLEKYNIAETFLKADLVTMILDRFKDGGLEVDDLKVQATALKKLKLDELRLEWYGDRYHLDAQKISLTQGEGGMIIAMYAATKSQPLFDLGNEHYICEEDLRAKYKGHVIGVKPDRWLVHDKNNKAYSLQELDELLKGKDKPDQTKIIDELGLVSFLRDHKTTADLAKTRRKMLEGFDEYGYIDSMSFYFTVVYVIYGLQSVVYLDFVSKTMPHMTEVFAVDQKTLRNKLNSDIKPGLDKMVIDIEANKFEDPTREEIFEDKELENHAAYFNTEQKEPTFI